MKMSLGEKRRKRDKRQKDLYFRAKTGRNSLTH